ncbi:PREDICTED: protein FATTY ACID EXPORT 2, chloroplastic-like [Nicotiana attenuata]|uniref:Protein fatty acid export 2, chloroplastic n=1 Tax=Nicotiana attenuata TaxID=49451 RepID=A0A1J6IW27_NICAT|nr:PREDICTED: protein FATTY ACID EXPORT 2, chloroplastic-like [Nicotiana attenuata]OIT01927.1 protein fatty acid export 2, chloroplastic [Nicotiana attenuata]
MGEFLAIAQSSIVLPHFRVQAWSQRQHFFAHSQPLRSLRSSLHPLNTPCTVYPNLSTRSKPSYWGVKASVVSDSTMPTTFTVDSAGPGIDILPETGGGGGDDSVSANGGGGEGNNGGNNNNNNDGGNEGESDEGKDHNNKKKMALSMSQKLTLGYAFLVGAGGFMGYLKSGSTKSLIAGGVSASLLYSVYAMLPTQPVLASSMGFVLSAALLGVMGSRFLKSKKVFPAGIVSFVSLVMTGGYLHGILRTAH